MTFKKGLMFVVFLCVATVAMAVPKWGYIKTYPMGVQLSYHCVQGIVNRNISKAIYLDDWDGVTTQEHKDREWYQAIYGSDYASGYQLSSDLGAVCWDYRTYIQGWVIFNPSTSWEVNAATTLASALDYVPLTIEWYNNFVSRGIIQGKQVLDIRNQWASAEACYTHMYTYHFSQCTAAFVGVQSPIDMNVRDFFVYARAFVFYFDNQNNTHPVSSTLINTIFSQTSKMYVMGGWALPEGTEVSYSGLVNYVSANNKWLVAGSPYGPRNLSFYNQYTTQASAQSQGTAITAGQKWYVAFMISDGDNVSMLYSHFKERWNDPARGQVPLGWGVSPWFSRYIAPCFFKWFMDHKSSNDYFTGSVSGTGYNYLMELSPSFRANYLAQTNSDMAAYGMQVGWVLNDSEHPLTDAVAGEFIDATGVKCLFADFSGNGAYKVWHDAMYIKSINTYTNDENAVLTQIRNRAAQLSKPGFIMVTCNGWGMTPTKIKWVADQLGSNYQVLRPDVFAKTYLKIYGYQY